MSLDFRGKSIWGPREDQLVADVVKNERPDLAELRANLVVQIAADKATKR